MKQPPSEKPTGDSGSHRLERLLRLIAGTCEAQRLEHYITGSIASMHYSVPRMTNDVDVVIAMAPWHAERFCAAFAEPEFYVDAEAARHAVAAGSAFNIIQVQQGVKADIMCFRETPFDEARLARRRNVELIPGFNAWIAAPEDIILKKLEFYREGGSHKHTSDIANIFLISGPMIDLPYILHWVPRLGIEREWDLIVTRLRQVMPPGTPGRP